MESMVFRRSSLRTCIAGIFLAALGNTAIPSAFAEDDLMLDPSMSEPATAPPALPDTAGSNTDVLAPLATDPPVTEVDVAADPTATESPYISGENEVRTTSRHNSRIPSYTLTRPSWGVSATGAIKALGGQSLAPEQTTPTRALQFAAEYQFPFLQDAGVFSAGPSVGIYPIIGGQKITNTPVSLWEAGGQVRYQARFFREQPVVPFAGYEMQYMNYRLNTGPSGSLTASGPLFGAMLLLNFIEPSSAAEFYVTQGVSRSYLTAEFKSLSGSDGKLAFSGLSLFLGLRLEF
jgi:hypothetical protein